MSTLILCRTCGKQITNINARNLFKPESEDLINKIAILTGLRLHCVDGMPKHICTCCYLDLSHSIAFREQCLKTEADLRNGMQRDTTTPDFLNSEEETELPAANSVRKQLQHKIVPTRVETNETSLQTQIVRARSTKQESSNATSISESAHNRRDIILARSSSDTECDKSINTPSPPKSSTVIKSECLVMDASIEVASDDSDNSTSDGSRKQEKRNVKQRGVSKTYVCHQCGKCFADASNLKVHILRHTGVKNFECPECGTKYFTRHLLNLHIRVRHRGEMPYACKYCDQRFFTSTTRCRHERVKHTKNLSYECKLCGKTYLTKSCLNKHKFLHTGERPYRCDVCNVGFPRNTNLKIHFRSKQHQIRANATINDANDEIYAITDGESDVDLLSEDFDV